jgi:hypothetical protein
MQTIEKESEINNYDYPIMYVCSTYTYHIFKLSVSIFRQNKHYITQGVVA